MDFSTMVSEKILNIYPYGSRVYGTNTTQSDYDYIMVVEGQSDVEYQVIDGDCNISVYDEKAFQRLIDDNDIRAFECLCMPKQTIILENKQFYYKISLPILRKSFSQKSSNSWVKAKKKLIIEQDFDVHVAKKSLFHSMRILIFGIQLATMDKIYDFSQANYLWNQINAMESIDWEVYNKEFKSTYNFFASQFKLVAPKN